MVNRLQVLKTYIRVMEIVNKHNNDILMAEMVENDFRFPMSKFIENISEKRGFISIAQMVRKENSLELDKQEMYKTDTWVYE